MDSWKLVVKVSKKVNWDAIQTILYMGQHLYPNNYIYLTCIHPHLEYAAQLWDPYNRKDIELLESVKFRSLHVKCVSSVGTWTIRTCCTAYIDFHLPLPCSCFSFVIDRSTTGGRSYYRLRG